MKVLGETMEGSDREQNVLKVTPLGAGTEVGRSCILVTYKQKCIMVNLLLLVA